MMIACTAGVHGPYKRHGAESHIIRMPGDTAIVPQPDLIDV